MARYDRLSLFQTSVMQVPETLNLVMSGGRGGGKSTAAIFLAIAHMQRYGEHAHVLVVRRTLKSLQDFEDALLGIFATATNGQYTYNRVDKVLRTAGATLTLASIDDPRSYDRLQGLNTTLLIVEEVTQHKSERILRMLRSNLRGPKDVPTRVVYVCNPGGPLSARIYDRHIKDRTPWVPYALPLGDDTDEVETWVTCPSTYLDNPTLSHDDYARRLREATHGNSSLLKQWLLGEWTSGSTLMYSAFDKDVNVLPAPDTLTVNTDMWRPLTATDFGLSAPSVSLLGLIAKRPVELRKGVISPKGSCWVIDEVTDAILTNPEDLDTSKQWSPGRLAEKIVNKAANYGIHGVIGVVDDMRGIAGDTVIQAMLLEGGFRSLGKPRKGRRSEGHVMINSCLQAAVEGNPARPHLYISPNAKYLLATLPHATRDPDDPDDIIETPACPEHAIDALRYLIAESRTYLMSGSGRTFGMY